MRIKIMALLLVVINVLLLACARTGQPSGINAWIDAPLDGLEFTLGQIVILEGHAASDEAIARIEFWVNGERFVEQSNPGRVGKLAHFEHIWLPESPGTYIVDLFAYGEDDAESAHDSITIHVLAEAVPEITSTFTPAAFDTDTPTPTLITPTTTPTREHTRTFTPPPPPDTSGPPAPAPASPKGGVFLGCSGSVVLRWNEVSDQSGIDEHRLELQRHPGDNNWLAASGSPWSGISGTSHSVPVECGWYYRWRVRARDGAGNWGAFSSWATFAVSLQ